MRCVTIEPAGVAAPHRGRMTETLDYYYWITSDWAYFGNPRMIESPWMIVLPLNKAGPQKMVVRPIRGSDARIWKRRNVMESRDQSVKAYRMIA